MRRPLVLAAAMLIGAAAGRAFAQTLQRTTATYKDWTVRCALHGAAKVCDMTYRAEALGGKADMAICGANVR
jgi:invasion protein IalB